MRSQINLHFIWLVLLVLVGCANAPRVETVQDSIAVAYLTVENVADTVNAAYKAKELSTAKTIELKRDLQRVKSDLDTARSLVLTDISGAQDALSRAQALLTIVQKVLEERVNEH